MDILLQDLRYAFRSFRNSPGFTFIAVTCLAVGIATNTTGFSCFNAILLRPFPFVNPDEIAWFDRRHEKRNFTAGISYKDFVDWKAQSRSFTAMAATSGRSLAITEGDEPERLRGDAVTWNLFPMLGVRPQLGRWFREDEDQPGAAGVVILSDIVWHRRYAGDSAILGRSISLNNTPYTVVGVMPPKFKFPQESEIWVPAVPLVNASLRSNAELSVLARVNPGTTFDAANRELGAVAARVNTQYGSDTDWVARVRPLAAGFVPDDVRTITIALMGAMSFVLVIACANVANLMLTRAAGRSREIAIRAAIGAGRGRIVRQLLTESVVIAVVAGLLSFPLTKFGIGLIRSAIPAEDPMPYYMEFTLDTTTMLYAVVVSFVTGILFGLAPALQVSRGRVYDALKEGGRSGSAGIARNRVRNGLVIAEIALSLVLLVGASLFGRNFLALQSADIGFDAAPILTARFYLPGTRYDSTAPRDLRVRDLLQRIEALPGVETAAISNLIPMDGGGSGGTVSIEGSTVERGKEPSIFWTSVAGHWFETLGVRPTEGRTFTEAEWRDSVPVAVINSAMATKLWPGKNAMGSRFRFTGDSAQTWLTVIGIVPDVRNNGLDSSEPEDMTAYLPYRFLPVRNHGLIVRARSGDPLALTTAVRAAIRASDPAMPVFGVNSMEKVRALSFWQYGLFGGMFAVFGGIALFLAAIGIYGVISFGVTQRTRDFGVRVALGASQQNVLGMVVRQGVVLASIGVGIGLIGAFAVTRGVQSLLIGVSATDPLSFSAVAAFLILVAAVASLVPARRATAVDPIVALRAE